MRCACCDRMLFMVTGYRKLPDGTRVEEDFCNVCRNAVHESNYPISVVETQENEIESLVNELIHNGVTPAKTPKY